MTLDCFNRSLQLVSQVNLSGVNASQENVFVEQITDTAYTIVLPTILGIGIFGNLLNLLTLQSDKLRSTGFIYIRAVAWFDLAGLAFVLLACLRIARLLPTTSFLIVLYQAHGELPLLNTFLAGSLFVATALTVDRFFLICRPYRPPPLNPDKKCRINIAVVFTVAFILHIPMSLEFKIDYNPCTLKYGRVNNPIIHAYKQNKHIYSVYQIVRELTRIGAVIMLSVLNFVLVRALNKANKRRQRMSKGRLVSSVSCHSGASTAGRVSTTLVGGGRSFEERRLSGMMIGMTLVYIVGNLPQAVLMVFNEVDHEESAQFQIFRAIANLMEINNHCLNFYIFCISSRDYMIAFLDIWKIHPKCLSRLNSTFISRNPSLRRLVSVNSAVSNTNQGRYQSFSPPAGVSSSGPNRVSSSPQFIRNSECKKHEDDTVQLHENDHCSKDNHVHESCKSSPDLAQVLTSNPALTTTTAKIYRGPPAKHPNNSELHQENHHLLKVPGTIAQPLTASPSDEHFTSALVSNNKQQSCHATSTATLGGQHPTHPVLWTLGASYLTHDLEDIFENSVSTAV